MSELEGAPAPRGDSDPEIQTLLFVRELWSGPSVVAPLMSTDLASAGAEGDALLEQQLFLREYLARSSPEVVARYSVPAETALVEVAVPLPREELPRRLQIDIPIAFACAVIPWGKDRWVTIPAAPCIAGSTSTAAISDPRSRRTSSRGRRQSIPQEGNSFPIGQR